MLIKDKSFVVKTVLFPRGCETENNMITTVLVQPRYSFQSEGVSLNTFAFGLRKSVLTSMSVCSCVIKFNLDTGVLTTSFSQNVILYDCLMYSGLRQAIQKRDVFVIYVTFWEIVSLYSNKAAYTGIEDGLVLGIILRFVYFSINFPLIHKSRSDSVLTQENFFFKWFSLSGFSYKYLDTTFCHNKNCLKFCNQFFFYLF